MPDFDRAAIDEWVQYADSWYAKPYTSSKSFDFLKACLAEIDRLTALVRALRDGMEGEQALGYRQGLTDAAQIAEKVSGSNGTELAAAFIAKTIRAQISTPEPNP